MINNLLSSLDQVKQTAPHKWVACCPAHADKNPSLAIKDDDGAVLFHCFGGCDSTEVLAAAGLKWGDILPQNKDFIPRPKPYPELEADYFVIQIWAEERRKGLHINQEDLARYKTALSRTGAAPKKQAAPYSRKLKSQDLVFLFFGLGAWERAAKSPTDSLVLPAFRDPFDFQWPVKNRRVILIDCGKSPTVYKARIGSCIAEIADLVIDTSGVIYE